MSNDQRKPNIQCSTGALEPPPGLGARPPRALQRPNCKPRGISQSHRVLGSCCGRGARAPGTPSERARLGRCNVRTASVVVYPNAIVCSGVAAGGAPALRDAGARIGPAATPEIKNLKFEFPWPHPSTTPLARRSFPAKAASLHLPSPHERSPKTNHPQTFGRA
jgi:hypothetical protein